MKNDSLEAWLEERGITLEEDFVTVFVRYAKVYKKKQFESFGGCVRSFGCE